MTTGLTAEQIRSYREAGFLVIRDLLDAAELERWRAAVDEGVARQLGNPRAELKVFDNQGRDNDYARVFVQCVNMWKVSGAMRELVLDARLYVLPGSQRTSRFDAGGDTSSARIDALFDAYPEWRDIEPAPVEVGAGGAVFLSGMVAHAAGPNMTRVRRRAFSILFMPDDAVFNGHQSALPDAVASRLQVGDPIADDEHLPLLYSRRY